MKIVNIGMKYTVYDDSLHTYDRLPIGCYMIGYTQDQGCFLLKHSEIHVTEKTYGTHRKKVEKVMNSFHCFERSMGVILSGDKGIGKSIFAKMLCEKAVQEGFPVVIVDAAVPGVARFIESIDQECVILFDEFDKTFQNSRENNEQTPLLSLFDGTAGGKKLFIVTCNELYGLNEFIVNRPGRFHYHFRFEYPSKTDIVEYLHDKLDEQYYGEIDKVISFSQRINLNYDCLRSIAFELNQGTSFSEAAGDLNILNINREEYNLYLYLDNGEILHHYRLYTNLFDSDGYDWTEMVNSSGRAVLDIRFDKEFVRYELNTNATIIPAEGLRIDLDDYEDNSETARYKSVKPIYLKFEKCNVKNLHYAV